jgi:hypothetical protein
VTAVVVPYTRVEPEVAAALAGVDPAPVWASTAADDRAYWRLLCGLWADGDTFVIVEHDVVASGGAVAGLLDCPEEWCAVLYGIGPTAGTALGCTKFSRGLTARHPDLIDGVPAHARGWNGLDGVVIGELHRRGEREHVHGPAVRHLHWEPKEARTLTTLRWTGDGSRYLHEDAQAGIPPMPPADFETDDPRVISIAVGSGLYTEDTSGDTPRRGRRQAAAPGGPVADTSAPAD